MEKIVKDYIKPGIKVNDFISRHHLLWEIAPGTTNEQLGVNPGPDDLELPDFKTKEHNVWEDN